MVIFQSKKVQNILSGEELMRVEPLAPNKYSYITELIREKAIDENIKIIRKLLSGSSFLLAVLFCFRVITDIPFATLNKFFIMDFLIWSSIALFGIIVVLSYFRYRNYPLVITSRGIVKEPILGMYWGDIKEFDWYKGSLTTLSIQAKGILNRNYYVNKRGHSIFKSHNIVFSDEQIVEAEKIFHSQGIPKQSETQHKKEPMTVEVKAATTVNIFQKLYIFFVCFGLMAYWLSLSTEAITPSQRNEGLISIVVYCIIYLGLRFRSKRIIPVIIIYSVVSMFLILKGASNASAGIEFVAVLVLLFCAFHVLQIYIFSRPAVRKLFD